jgi:LysR family cys regulon transcriptional activator
VNVQQLRYVFETARRGLNVSEAAEALFTSQPGVSKQIRLLEEELGVDIFIRHGKRLVAITEPGQAILTIATRVLRDLDNIRQVSHEFAAEDVGELTLATTHTQARYALPAVVAEFTRRYPKVRLVLHQGNPAQVCDEVAAGQADIGIATEGIEGYDGIVSLPCYQWNRCVIAAPDHAIFQARTLTLEDIARYPIVTYDADFAGRSLVNKAFVARGLKPNIVLTAIDADIIKTYVRLGLGIGIVAAMAYDAKADSDLRSADAAHLFESSTAHIGLRRNDFVRGYIYAFIELFAPHLSRKVVDMALSGGGSDAGL